MSLAVYAFTQASADAYVVERVDEGLRVVTGHYPTSDFMTMDYSSGVIDFVVNLPSLSLHNVSVGIEGTSIFLAAGNY